MKLLVLVDRLDHAGGLERSLANKVRSWCSDGNEVHIATIEQAGPDYYSYDERAKRMDLGVHYNRSLPLTAKFNVLVAFRHLLVLRDVCNRIRPTHIVHCGYGFDFYFLPLISRGAFLVKENHSSRYVDGYREASFLGRFKRVVRRWFDSRYHASVFLSAEEARLSGLSNTVVIPNALDERPVPVIPRKKRIISAGRICAVKGFDRLIDAWALAAPKLPGWDLAIYGDGAASDVEALKSKILSLGLSTSVSVNPATPEIIDLMAESSIYAMTSRSECFPMVLLEAMQTGLPIVAYDCPTGPRNIINHDVTGLVVPDGDSVAYADALVRLATDANLAEEISSNGQRESLRYASDDIARMWTALFSIGVIR
jgi:glycosyltransferase involved in cell wall biosynthesis